ncbi:MAG: nitrogen fixation protein NifZ [Azovibrio sp.]|uniref:nitrogen fixation protein NifZ n=1 Tax=Azovibrio sp. TaxID=1872673 RepID=UPI003C78693D
MLYCEIGDIVFCKEALFNDGGIPDLPEDALLARAGTRGVIVQTGVIEADERQAIFLVRFEGEDGLLGGPVGCLPDELIQSEAEAAILRQQAV